MEAAPATKFSAADRHRELFWLFAPAVFFLLSVALTQPAFIGDSFDYVVEILRVRDGAAPATTLWESGHILWRPLGYLLAPLFLQSIPNSLAWTPVLKMGAGLIALNLAAALVSTVLIYDLCRRL